MVLGSHVDKCVNCVMKRNMGTKLHWLFTEYKGNVLYSLKSHSGKSSLTIYA